MNSALHKVKQASLKAEWISSFKEVLPLWVFAKAALWSVVYLAVHALPERSPNGNKDYIAFPQHPFWNAFARWDSGWYHRIAEHGYENPSARAFFPLYPKLSALSSTLLGSDFAAGLLLSNLASLGAVFFFYLWLRSFDVKLSRGLALTLSLVHPSAIFFSAYYTESLFFFFVTLSFYAFQKRMYVLLACAGFLASLTRSTGVFLCPSFMVAFLLQAFSERNRAWKTYVLPLVSFAFIPLGVVSYAAALHFSYGDALSFVKAQAGWGRSSGVFPLLSIQKDLKGEYWLDALFACLALVLGVYSFLKKDKAGAIFILLCVLFPLSTGTSMSMMRFTLVLPSFHRSLALLCVRKELRWGLSLLWASLSAVFALRFALWYWAG